VYMDPRGRGALHTGPGYRLSKGFSGKIFLLACPGAEVYITSQCWNARPSP